MSRESYLNRSNTRWLYHDGKAMCLSDWSKEKNINPKTLSNRLNQLGWSIKRALTEPVQIHRRAS
jgi:hypothetical protein